MSWLDDLRALLGQAQAPLRSGAEAVVQHGLQPATNALGGAGNFARGTGMTLGNLVTGNTDAAQSAARRAFLGIGDESQRISGEEALAPLSNRLGVEPNSVGRIAMEAITDPVMMGAAAKAGVAAPGFMRNLLSRGAAAAPEAAAPAGQTLRGQGLSTYITDAQGQNFIRPPTPSPRPTNNFGANGEQLFSNGSTQMSQAEQWSAQQAGMGVKPPATGIVRPSASSSPSAAEGVLYRPPTSSGIPISDAPPAPQSLQDLRRQFTVVRDAGFDATNSPTFGRVAGPASYKTAQQEVGNLLQNPTYNGQYNPSTLTAAIREGAPPGVGRHEVYHGIMDAARNSGDSSALSIPSRISNAMQTSRSPLLQGLGYAGEEGLAHGLQQGRGTIDQLRGAWNFFDRPPSPVYGDLIGDMSPAAGYIYRNRLIPQAVRGAGLAGAGAAAYGTGRAIQGE